MHFYCERCKKEYPVATHAYACECGGLFHLYQTEMDEDSPHTAITLGETMTPLLPLSMDGLHFYLKMEDRQPTGSFKDRGAKRLIGELSYLGIERVVIDSSGNAGAAVAAYAAAAGIACRVYVPDDISQERVKQITAYGADVVRVPNGRMNAGSVARAELGSDYYASHVYNPLFADGVGGMAHEIYEQLGGAVPEYIFVPVGNGSLLLGLYHGCRISSPCRVQNVRPSWRRSTTCPRHRAKAPSQSPFVSVRRRGWMSCARCCKGAGAMRLPSRTVRSSRRQSSSIGVGSTQSLQRQQHLRGHAASLQMGCRTTTASSSPCPAAG